VGENEIRENIGEAVSEHQKQPRIRQINQAANCSISRGAAACASAAPEVPGIQENPGVPKGWHTVIHVPAVPQHLA
jgi:hypothetical protein